MFTEKEIEYLNGQRLARIATVSEDSQPDVAAVGYDFDGECFFIGGLKLAQTLKYRNAIKNPKVAIVVDDLEPGDRFIPRGVKVHGTAGMVTREGYVGPGEYIRVMPVEKWSWGVNAPTFQDGKPVTVKTDRGGEQRVV